MRHRFAALLAALLFVQVDLFACDANVPCDRCAKDGGTADSKAVTDGLGRFYSMNALIKKAFDAGDFAQASTLAKEYLDLAAVYRCDWNYGNAIHDGNRYLGLMSLGKGDTEAAVRYLIEAGKSTGSPQLDSFGPDLELANALLKAGRPEPVKRYLRSIQSFWKMDNGQVDDWLASIDRGEKPELNRFMKKPGVVEILVLWLFFMWPVVVVAAFFLLLWRRIARKWWFAIAGVVAGYVAMALGSWGSALVLPAMVSAMDSSNASLIMAVMFAGVGSGFLLAILAVFGVSRIFVARPEPA